MYFYRKLALLLLSLVVVVAAKYCAEIKAIIMHSCYKKLSKLIQNWSWVGELPTMGDRVYSLIAEGIKENLKLSILVSSWL